jgi:anti-sigma-K factor RskA
MKGTALSEDAFAFVYVNNIRKTSFLDVVKLPDPPAEKQYQLWAIVDGKPTDMGVFALTTENGALQTVPFIENAQAYAVTLEPKGGSVAPTLDQMYVVGSVKG